MSVLKDMLTERDNHTFDLSRFLWAAGVIWFLVLATYALHLGQKWDPEAFGLGLAAVLGAGGGVVAFKAMKAEAT